MNKNQFIQCIIGSVLTTLMAIVLGVVILFPNGVATNLEIELANSEKTCTIFTNRFVYKEIPAAKIIQGQYNISFKLANENIIVTSRYTMECYNISPVSTK